MGVAQSRDGGKALAYLVKINSETAKSTAIAKGKVVAIAEKASSGSVFGSLPLKSLFIANKEITPANGDKYYDVTLQFCGFATGKSISASKNSTESKIDYDGATSVTSDGVVTKSGSISGLMVTESLDSGSAVNPLKLRFDSITEVDEDGNIVHQDAQTTVKDIIMLAWNGRDAVVGDLLEVEFIPAFFTNLSKGGEAGSNQTFSVDFSGNYTDDEGFLGGVVQVRITDGLIKALLKTERTDYNT